MKMDDHAHRKNGNGCHVEDFAMKTEVLGIQFDNVTMEEAAALIEAMEKCFDPLGTELKTE